MGLFDDLATDLDNNSVRLNAFKADPVAELRKQARKIPAHDVLLHQYGEVCKSYHAIDDFRAKLLTLLPGAAGLASIILLATKPENSPYLVAVGIFGAFVVFGLGMYEFAGSQRCENLQRIARNLEKALGLNSETGQFQCPTGKIRAGTASWIVYLVVFIGCLWLAISARFPWLSIL